MTGRRTTVARVGRSTMEPAADTPVVSPADTALGLAAQWAALGDGELRRRSRPIARCRAPPRGRAHRGALPVHTGVRSQHQSLADGLGLDTPRAVGSAVGGRSRAGPWEY